MYIYIYIYIGSLPTLTPDDKEVAGHFYNVSVQIMQGYYNRTSTYQKGKDFCNKVTEVSVKLTDVLNIDLIVTYILINLGTNASNQRYSE